ncbi:unnamed protein product, partial [Ilex paraguariensis]
SIQARFCLNLRGRRRSGSPATTSVDPTKSLNRAAARSLISDSPATRSMKNLSKICSLISDSPAIFPVGRANLLFDVKLVSLRLLSQLDLG